MLTPPGGPARPTLRIITRIDADYLDRAQRHLLTIFHDRMIANRARLVSLISPKWPEGTTAILPVALIGTSLGLLGLALSSFVRRGEPMILGMTSEDFALFFALVIPIFWIGHWAVSFTNWVNKPWSPYWRLLARMRTTAALKGARAAAPYQAEYEFEGERVVHRRNAANRAVVAWSSSLRGWSLEGEQFTLLFKQENAVAPYCIILHEPSAAFNAYLDNLGVRPIVSAHESRTNDH